MTYWQRWISHPQSVWLRKAAFQIHLWSGIGVGLYVLMISVTGSILVYRNELYEAATPASGKVVGKSVPLGIWAVSKLLELHDDLLAGNMGRSINGLAGLLVILLALTGIVVWWPGIKAWRRSLIVHRNVGWRRFTWDLHSMIGFWTLGIIALFGLSGAYLGNPQVFQDLADRIQPPTAANGGDRFVDQVVYWLAYLHFGRINGIGIPCHGPGLCDQATKLTWAIAGLTPAAMFVTGAVMWWNRVARKKFSRMRDTKTQRQ
jgi:uncharacterized iron-regulated membrane protein